MYLETRWHLVLVKTNTLLLVIIRHFNIKTTRPKCPCVKKLQKVPANVIYQLQKAQVLSCWSSLTPEGVSRDTPWFQGGF